MLATSKNFNTVTTPAAAVLLVTACDAARSVISDNYTNMSELMSLALTNTPGVFFVSGVAALLLTSLNATYNAAVNHLFSDPIDFMNDKCAGTTGAAVALAGGMYSSFTH